MKSLLTVSLLALALSACGDDNSDDNNNNQNNPAFPGFPGTAGSGGNLTPGSGAATGNASAACNVTLVADNGISVNICTEVLANLSSSDFSSLQSECSTAGIEGATGAQFIAGACPRTPDNIICNSQVEGVAVNYVVYGLPAGTDANAVCSSL